MWRLPDGRRVPLGGRAARVFARFIDVILLFVVGLIALGMATSGDWSLMIPGIPASIAIYGGYVYGLGRYGRSPGKALFGLRVVRTNGRRIGWIRGVIVREVARTLLTLLPMGGVLDLALLFRNDRRTAHDYVSDSVVVYDPR